jgi:hypothetical protein
MSTEKDPTKAAIDQATADANAAMEQAAKDGKPNPSGIGVAILPVAAGEDPTPIAAFDERVASLRAALVDGRIKLLVLQAVEATEKGLEGRTEVLTDSVSFHPAMTLWAIESDLAGSMANNVYEAVQKALEIQMQGAVDKLKARVKKASTATEN